MVASAHATANELTEGKQTMKRNVQFKRIYALMDALKDAAEEAGMTFTLPLAHMEVIL